ncbi:MAG: hypothetical protein EYC70_09135 [Planctomycetota bacterium]|nr:MAG: hypothetical protein EYC70_09135 [Planctomycetota bacterium]
MTETAAGAAARQVALELLLGKGDFPTRRFAAAADAAGLQGRDRGLARELVSGVIRRRRTLDALFKAYSDRRTVEPEVLWTLRLAVYQRFFLQNVPAYAAFDATLEAAKPRLGRALGFCNAVLRALDRDATRHERAEILEAAANRLDLDFASWEFGRAVFPDPDAEPTAYWAVSLSYPDVLVERWFEQAGAGKALARLRALNQAPPLTLRVNARRATAASVLEAFQNVGIGATQAPIPDALLLEDPPGEVSALPGFAEGLWSVQDLQGQEAVALAKPSAGEKVLDLCAAPGGKSFAAAERGAEVTACDVDAERLKLLDEDARRLGHPVSSHVISHGGKGVPSGEWDLVILDVPCSNTGVLGRRPEARWRFTLAELGRCVKEQKSIIKWALPAHVGSRTRVLWSTCSLEPEENGRGAERAARRAGLQVLETRSFEPDARRSGGFAAVLGRA